MKILVVSDSHKNIKALSLAVSTEGPDMLLHLGDHDHDCKSILRDMPGFPVRAVRGNCDPGSKELDVDEFCAEGVRIIMTHGHLYGVKYTLDSLINSALIKGADVVLFGHTHRQHYEVFEGTHILNPGSVGFYPNTYAVLNVAGGAVDITLKQLPPTSG